MEDALRELIESTFTRDNIHKKQLLLREFFAEYFFTEGEKEPIKLAFGNFLNGQNTTEHIRGSLLSLSDNFFASFSQDSFHGILDELGRRVDAAPLLTMYVPTILPPSEVAKLGGWVRGNVNDQAFIDISVDPNVIGGCAFVWNGTYHDFSLSHYFTERRTDIRQLFANYDSGK